jgi:hypothetical protein
MAKTSDTGANAPDTQAAAAAASASPPEAGSNEKSVRQDRPTAASRIEYGEIVNGKLLVTVFEPGDVVTLDKKSLQALIACSAVNAAE